MEADTPAQVVHLLIRDRAQLVVRDRLVGLTLQFALDDEAQHGGLHAPHAASAHARAGLFGRAPAHQAVYKDPDQRGVDAIPVDRTRVRDGAQERALGDLLEGDAQARAQVAQQPLEVPGDALALPIGVAGQVEGDLGVLGGLVADGAQRGLTPLGPYPGWLGQRPPSG